jgi:hypothetical protein
MTTASATFAKKTSTVRRLILPLAVLCVIGVPAPRAEAAKAQTATVLLAYPNPSLYGTTVTFTAVVLAAYDPSLPPPTGQVAFWTEVDFNNPILGGILNTYQITLALSSLASNTAQFRSLLPFSIPYPYNLPLPFLVPTGSLTACYGGDANYAGSCATMYPSFVGPDTTLTLISSSNPSFVGRSVQFIAAVTAQLGVAAGVVSFADATTGASLGSVPLDASGHAVSPPTALALGAHVIQATYAPSTGSLYTGSTNTLNEIVLGFP